MKRALFVVELASAPVLSGARSNDRIQAMRAAAEQVKQQFVSRIDEFRRKDPKMVVDPMDTIFPMVLVKTTLNGKRCLAHDPAVKSIRRAHGIAEPNHSVEE